MPSLKPTVRKGQIKADGKSNIKIRVSHNKKVRYIATPFNIEPRYMLRDGSVSSKHPSHSKLSASIQLILQNYNEHIYDLGLDVIYMDCNDLIKVLKSHRAMEGDFIKYARSKSRRYREMGKFSLADTYDTTIDHLIRYTKKDVIAFKAINITFLQGLEMYFRYRELSANTISVYMRNIRALFNDAIDEDLIKPGLYPFRKYKIPQEETIKRALTIQQLRLLYYGPYYRKVEQRALDQFFLSFYLLGMNFADMLFLKKDDINNGRLIYRRKKTGRVYSILIQPEAQKIIDRYQGDEYLLKFMEDKERITQVDRSTPLYKDIIRETNKLLKRIAKGKKTDIPMSTYYARHTWATIAAELGISRDVISHALGHSINSVTDLYIDFDLGKVDQANRQVIDYIKISC